MKPRGARGALVLALAAGASWLAARGVPELRAQQAVPVDTYRVIKTYPHDATAYTQGLIYRDGFLFESTGLNGQSTLRKVTLETGEVVQQHRVDNAHFAEGLAEWNGQLVQLTWRSHVAFVYDLASFAPRRTLLNGIAYDADGNRLFVTGKLWPRLFQIEVAPRK